MLQKVSEVAAVKRRDRWQQDNSFKRYAKETELLSELNKVPQDTVKLGASAMSRLEDRMLGRFFPTMQK